MSFLYKIFTLLFSLLIIHNSYAGSEHVHELDQLIISAPSPRSTANTALSVSILSGDELRMKANSSIGETLKNEPGISNQSFGPGVGQPVIRGQAGPRVHVLQNGLGSLDVSSLSPDHANSTEVLWAEQIEVLKGAATLLYGSGAIGGVVNVLDNRIPDRVPDTLFEGAFEQRYNTVNEGKSSAFKVDGGKGMFAWHFDGFYRDSVNQQIADNAIKGVNNGGRLLNSNARTTSGTAGFSIIGDTGFIGLSINRLDNNYGIPPGDEPEEEVRIDLQQTRYDLKAEIKDPLAFADTLRFRLSYNDYQHIELENGAAGTLFSNEGFESRVELIQKPWAFFDHGVLGLQTKNSEVSALGEEAVIPKADVNSFSFFTMQDIHTEYFTYEMALRIEQQWIDPLGLSDTSHTPISFSTSVLWSVTDEDSFELTFSRSERAPSVQELFSNGAHHGTSSYNIGNANLTVETSQNIELGFHLDHDLFQVDLNLYQNWVQDYISQINSGLSFNVATDTFENNCIGDCLPVFNAQQHDAEFQGFEAQIKVPLMTTNYGHLNSEFFADYVRGRFSNGGDIPRMPPLRYGAQLSLESINWTAEVRLTRAEKQQNPGINETKTDGYWLLDLSTNYRLGIPGYSNMLLFAKANNLLDQDIRQAVSFLRNSAPEAGRGVEIGLRIEF